MAFDKKTFDLDKLKISELWKFDYKDTMRVIEALERSVLESCVNKVKTIDNFDDYIQMLYVIVHRMSNGDFDVDLNTEKKKENFREQTKRIFFNLSVIGYVNSASMSIEKFVNNEISSINENVNTIKSDLNSQKLEIAKQIDKQKEDVQKEVNGFIEEEKKELANVEHNTLTHVLSLMGIFSAVITMIMSAVLTSSAWLNNARASSAVVGFAIPNLVALLCIVAMLGLVYLFVHRDVVILHVEEKDANSKERTVLEEQAELKQDSHSKTLSTADGERKIRRGYNRYKFFVFLVILLVIISVVLTFVALSVMNEINKPHERYIISESEYRVIEEDKGDSVEKYYVFEIDGVSYRCEYDESFKNDGKLYYCKEHGVLEK